MPIPKLALQIAMRLQQLGLVGRGTTDELRLKRVSDHAKIFTWPQASEIQLEESTHHDNEPAKEWVSPLYLDRS